GVYNKKLRELTFANGGHPPPIAIVGESPEISKTVVLESRGLIIGGLPEQKYEKAKIALKTFTRLYIYSDGIYEVTRPDGSMLKLDDFINLVSKLSHKGDTSPAEIIEEIRKTQGSDVFDDDVSLMEVRFLQPSNV
ncbi:MAG: serine/threonine-protein phosphatase, partial [Desulfobacteraceae bacterium]|nr:serine/threonine-protein phosphatase [Desulfobacteraceae bacterium]